jgi:hypothetical protein
VRIFGRKSRTRRTLGSHQIRFFLPPFGAIDWSRNYKGARGSLNARPRSWTSTGGRPHRHQAPDDLPHHCQTPLPPSTVKVSLIKFPSSLWSRRSKPYRKPTTMAWENPNSGEPPCSAMACRHERELAAAIGRSHREPPDLRWMYVIRS